MTVSPIPTGDAPTYAAPAYGFDDEIDTEPRRPEPPAHASLDDLPSELQSGMAKLERRFMAFTQMLSREFASLERTFGRLLRSLAGDAHPAPVLSHSPYDGIIRRAAERNGVDPALVGAVARRESGFQRDAVSPAGARGLMQLMPATARQLGVTDPFDPDQNIDGGTRLLRSLLDRYDGKVDLALAAYNAGPAAVDRYGGVPPYPETRAYVDAIMADYRSAALSPT